MGIRWQEGEGARELVGVDHSAKELSRARSQQIQRLDSGKGKQLP